MFFSYRFMKALKILLIVIFFAIATFVPLSFSSQDLLNYLMEKKAMQFALPNFQ